MAAKKHTCTKCKRDFKSAQALGVHKYRKHSDAGKTWNTAKKKAAPKAKNKPQPEPVEVVLNHCPCCGYNLEAHARAYAGIVRAKR